MLVGFWRRGTRLLLLLLLTHHDAFVQGSSDTIEVQFTELEYKVSEDDNGGVVRLGVELLYSNDTDAGTVTVSFETVGGTATTYIADTDNDVSDFPSTCQQSALEGYENVGNGVDTVRRVYCGGGGTSVNPPDARNLESSLFTWNHDDPAASDLWQRQCIDIETTETVPPNAGTMLWSDLNMRITTTSSLSSMEKTLSDDSTFHSWKATESLTTPVSSLPDDDGFLVDVMGLGLNARPIPFPFHNVTVWLDWEAFGYQGRLLWVRHDGFIYEQSFLAVNGGSLGNPAFMNAYMNPSIEKFYVISNGIDIAHIGCETSATLIRFDFVNSVVEGLDILADTLGGGGGVRFPLLFLVLPWEVRYPGVTILQMDYRIHLVIFSGL